MYSNHAENPRGGGTVLGHFQAHGIEHLRVHGVAAPLLGLQDLEESRLAHLLHCFVRHALVAVALFSTHGQRRAHGSSGLNQLLCPGAAQSVFVDCRTHNYTYFNLTCYPSLRPRDRAPGPSCMVANVGHVNQSGILHLGYQTQDSQSL